MPAWPPRSLPRLYVRAALSEGAAVQLDAAQANYLGNVLRLGIDAEMLLFDGASGEWLARIADSGRKRMTLVVERRTRPLEQVPDLTLAFAPVKRAQVDWLVEKATELGVARLQPVITQRTVVERVKLERLQAIAIEAAEQCGRTLLPEIAEPVSLSSFLSSQEDALYFADETGGEPVQRALRPGRATILTGPEGGFTDDERTAVRARQAAHAISLGPRILRAETAALAAVAAYMALAGDWR
ncbi:16S rRNA (uracil(1498)-N(3))-methyltransferase [uncultured Sphingomonas sp.]|uniref:16S rRNA (uracil(1498)-N(3))-methyltransferase n=1 Tax=uncultured Sphingomonas sp. TaxID=158754 RepID=UPI0025F901FA|nr:16S rRNA (uracil(1498)-N(3))-methyltransferase [uncultured Sphingomonas sp.]